MPKQHPVRLPPAVARALDARAEALSAGALAPVSRAGLCAAAVAWMELRWRAGEGPSTEDLARALHQLGELAAAEGAEGERLEGGTLAA